MSDTPEDMILKESYSAAYQLDTPSIILAIREGIGYKAFGRLMMDSPFSLQEWSRILHLTERSLQRYKKENKTFDSLQSEKIIQIILLYKKGIEVFGSREHFDIWLDTISPALGQIKPKEILDSAFGIALIEDELTRIAFGVLA